MKFNANVTTYVLDLQLKNWRLRQPKMADTPPKAMESSVAQESRQPVWNMALSTWKYDFCPRRSLIKLHDRLSLFKKLLAWTKQNYQESFRIVVVTGCSWSSSGWSLLIQSTGTKCPLKHGLQWSHRLGWKREVMEGHAPLELKVVAFSAKNLQRFCMLKLQPFILQNLSVNWRFVYKIAEVIDYVLYKILIKKINW